MPCPLASVSARFQTAVLAAIALAAFAAAAHGEGGDDRSASPAVRRVHVHRTWCEPGMESDPRSGISLFAHAEALGLRWESLLLEVRLGALDGKPVRAARGAPQGYADEKGIFFMSARAPVFHDRMEWRELRASIPYEKALDLPWDRQTRLTATFRASCSGLSSVSEIEITLPPEKAEKTCGASRALRVLAMDVYPNVGHVGNVPGTQRHVGSVPHGLLVESFVEAVGLDRAKIVGQLSFRREDGRPLTGTDPRTGKKIPFVHTAESDVVADQAQILTHFVPCQALGLPPGEHHLILCYLVKSGGLSASLEEEQLLHVGNAVARGGASE